MPTDDLTGMEFTGERFSPSYRDPRGLAVNLRRHADVIPHITDRRVIELGCGNGLGTYLYSCVASHVTAVDYSDEALKYGELFPCVSGRVHRICRDIVKDGIPQGEYDAAVAVEFLEHVERPQDTLVALKAMGVKSIYFSVPLNSLSMSKWHRYDIRGLKDVTDLFDPLVSVEKYNVLDRCWITGFGNFK